MPVRIEAKHRRVEQMRHPRQRVPVRRLTRCDRPTHRFKTQARPHLRVGRHIIGVVVINEIVPDRAGEEQQRPETKREHDLPHPSRYRHLVYGQQGRRRDPIRFC